MNNVVKNLKTSPKKSVTAKQLAKSNLTKRKNPDWDNLDRGYRYLTLDMKLPHDLAVAVMGNVIEESQGDYKAVLKNGGGRGLIQWDGKKIPSGRYSLWGSIWASVAKPANVYDSTTDTVKNYWAPWGGLKGDKVRLKFIKAPLKEKARIYAESYLRPGKPRIADRQLSAMQLDSIYNPRIKDILVLKGGGMLEFLKNGGQVRKMQTAAGGPLQSTPKELKYNNNYYDIMEKVAEQNYKNWGFPNIDYALLHALNDNTYNYRGYYNKYPNGKGNAIDHWTDEFKTVYHPTFSNESKYSGKKSLYNPKGIKGGSWLFGKFFIPSKDLLMELFKKGGGIHIKEKNKGKFTSYCGGKVTNECILKGKNSSNPAIRKRATFADNARHFKHLMGGSLNYYQWKEMSPELLLTYRTNRAKAYLNNPTIGNLWNAAKTYLGGNDPEDPNVTKMVAPDILPGKVPGGFSILKVRSLKLPAITNDAEAAAALDWMLTQGYRYNPKGNPIKLKPRKPVNNTPKPQYLDTDYTLSGTAFERFSEGKQYGIAKKGKVSTTDKYSRAMEKQDARITNAGNSNMKKAQLQLIIDNFDKYPKGERVLFEKSVKNLYRRGRPVSEINKFKRDFYRRLGQQYGFFKQGGKAFVPGVNVLDSNPDIRKYLKKKKLVKRLQGGFLSKVGNFLNSDTGKLVTTGVLNLFNLGKGISSMGKVIDNTISAKEALTAREKADKEKSFADHYNRVLQEEPMTTDYLGTVINNNGVDLTNRAYTKAANSFSFDNSQYDLARQEIDLQAAILLDLAMRNFSQGLLNSLGGISSSLLNKKSNSIYKTNFEPPSFNMKNNSPLYNSLKFWSL